MCFKVLLEFFVSNMVLIYLNLSFSFFVDFFVLDFFFKVFIVNLILICLKLGNVEIMYFNWNRSKMGDFECVLVFEILKVNIILIDLDLSDNLIGEVGI